MQSQTSTFSSLGLSEDMLYVLNNRGFSAPTHVQCAVIPLLLAAKKDLAVQAQTGTGKTAAFGIPLLETLSPAAKQPQVIILTPTRELAMQVAQELNSLQSSRKLSILPVYGGQPMGGQIRELKKGVHVIVGTPGRMLDHLSRGTIRTNQVTQVILDEADEMLNQGFIEDIELIFGYLPQERRTLLFSATMPKRILSLAEKYMKERDEISVKPSTDDSGLTHQISILIQEQDKLEGLTRLIDIHPDFYALVFCRTKADTDRVASSLQNKGYAAEAVHGDMSQAHREKTLGNFRKRRTAVLIATDVAARGIDISHLTHVINYALPQDAESYLHRIGRTGRAGNRGTAISLVTPAEARKLSYYQRVLKLPIQQSRLPKINSIVAVKRKSMQENIHRILQEQRHESFVDFASSLAEQGNPVDIIASLLAHNSQHDLCASSYREIKQISDQRDTKKKSDNPRFIARKKKRRAKQPWKFKAS